MRVKIILHWLIFGAIPYFLLSGCGDLEPEMQDTRTVTVILNMDFDQRSSLRTSSVSAAELNEHNTHLILALPSGKNLHSNYLSYSSRLAEGFMDHSPYHNREITMEIPLDKEMRLFAFLFTGDYYSYSFEDFSLVDPKPDVGLYGKSEPFTINTDTNSLSLGITLCTTTAPTASITPTTITTSGSAVVQSTETGTAYLVNTTVTVSNLASITGAADSQWNSFAISSAATNTYLTATGLVDGTYKVYAVDCAGNLSSASSNSVTVATTVTDTTAPVIETVTAVTTPTSDSTPDYTFSSTEAGSIAYGGPCATAGSATTNAIVGHNLIIFNTLSDGSYINCTITVTNDPAGNDSNTLQIPDFTVQTISTLPAPDNLTASGTSTSVTLKWNAVTDASSYTLYWDNVSGIDSSDNTFNNITNDNYTHNNLVNGTTYYYKVAAVNSSGTVTLSSEKIYITNLWDGMVAHYSFNGNANNVKANYNGTVSGATLSRGRGNDNNTAYSFDGVDDYIDFGSGILSGNGSFTIVVSINSTTTSSRILQQRDAQGFNGQYMLDILDNGSIKFNTYYYGFKWNVTSSSALNDGSWHHLAFVQKDNGGQMYLNGILEQTDNTGGKVNLTSSLKTYIGGDLRDNNSYYSGKVDDLRIYSRALSVSEIQTLHNIID
jgi:hypothetical protein